MTIPVIGHFEHQLTVSICRRKETAVGTAATSDTVSASHPVHWCSDPWDPPTGIGCRKRKDNLLSFYISIFLEAISDFMLVNQKKKLCDNSVTNKSMTGVPHQLHNFVEICLVCRQTQ